MVARLAQASFQPANFDVSHTNLHCSGTSPSRVLAIFIHGLGGSGYGTWGNFPKYVFEAPGEDRCDVAIFDYASGFRRVKTRKAAKASMHFYISQVVDAIRQTANEYDSIFLVGHSLGGLIAESAATDYLLNRPPNPYGEISPLAAIVYMGSPRAGSLWSPPVIGNLIGEGRMLQAFPSHSAGIDSYMVSHTDVALTSPLTPHHTFLPRYAFYSGSDRWVKQFSSTFGIPANQRIPLMSSHTAMTKPSHPNSEQVARLHAIIRDVTSARLQRERELAHTHLHADKQGAIASTAITTEFWAPADASHWFQVYNEVRQFVGNSNITVLDRGASDSEVDLLISASHAQGVADDQPVEVEKFEKAHAKAKGNPKLTLGLVPVGVKASDAVNVILGWHASAGSTPNVYVEAAPDTNALRNILTSWIGLVIDKDPRRSRMNHVDRSEYFPSDERLYNLAEERTRWT